MVSPLYVGIMLTALATAIVLGRKRQAKLPLQPHERMAIAFGAFCGAMILAKLPFVLADPEGLRSGTAWLGGGKTIVFGLVGGYLGVELAKWILEIDAKTGDAYVVPVAAAIAIGRLGCFEAGCCYGSPTSLPWGVHFHDHELRHPTQLYEVGFHTLAALTFWRLEVRNAFPTNRIKLYILAYLGYRFLTEFIRPEPRVQLGLTIYQWLCLGFAPLFVALWWRDARALASRKAEMAVAAPAAPEPPSTAAS